MSHADDLPSPNELHHLPDHYGLGDDGFVSLLVEFGWLAPSEDRTSFTGA